MIIRQEISHHQKFDRKNITGSDDIGYFCTGTKTGRFKVLVTSALKFDPCHLPLTNFKVEDKILTLKLT